MTSYFFVLKTQSSSYSKASDRGEAYEKSKGIPAVIGGNACGSIAAVKLVGLCDFPNRRAAARSCYHSAGDGFNLCIRFYGRCLSGAVHWRERRFDGSGVRFVLRVLCCGNRFSFSWGLYRHRRGRTVSSDFFQRLHRWCLGRKPKAASEILINFLAKNTHGFPCVFLCTPDFVETT